MITAIEATSTAPPDAVDVTLEDFDPSVERIRDCWYARDVTALLAAPDGLPAHVIDELRAWVRSNDANVRRRRPCCVEIDRRSRSSYVFTAGPGRHAPSWWRDAVQQWHAEYHRLDRRDDGGR